MHLSAGENKSLVLSPVHTHSPFICIHNSGRVKQCSKLFISSELKGYSFPEHLSTCGPGGHIGDELFCQVQWSCFEQLLDQYFTTHPTGSGSSPTMCAQSLVVARIPSSLTVNPFDSVSFSFQAQWNNSSLRWGVRALACAY